MSWLVFQISHRRYKPRISIQLSNGENCIRMRQVHLFEKEVTSELCWKKRLGTFGVWD